MHSGMMRIANPLPRQYITDTPGVGGVIKLRPEDFLVDELPLYEPCGEGEHLYLCLEKRSVSHAELLSCLRRHFDVTESAIGYAGMKDKVGITRQIVSIQGVTDPPDLELPHDRIQVLWATRHRNKIRRGHLAGNRFVIRIRDVEPTAVPRVRQILDVLERSGVPNYFGLQRFGYRRNTHLYGAALLRHDYEGLARELLGTTGTPFPEFQRERREAFDAGRYEDAAAQWTTADRAELIVCRALARRATMQHACTSVGRTSINFWLAALQSAVFNRVLDERLERGTIDQLFVGDLAWKHDSRAVFAVTEEELQGDTLARRLEAFEISPSGPLWGRRMTTASGDALEAEVAALATAGIEPDGALGAKSALKGARRGLRVPLVGADVDAGVDEYGGYIRVKFELPRGAYATVALREIMKTPDDRMVPGLPPGVADD